MNLNKYQSKVIADLNHYLDCLRTSHGDMVVAFRQYWQHLGVNGVQYQNHIKNCPHVCFKVPTGGGKTLLAVHSIQPIFQLMTDYISDKSKLVIWLTPSTSILQQTALALKNPEHPYHLQLKGAFNGKLNVFEREDVLMGAGFSPSSVKDCINVVVMSFDSLKSSNKDNRRAFKENGALCDFADKHDSSHDLPEFDSTSLINTIRRMRPLVIVDESHNANTNLSTEMLNSLNPCFVLDLTATPKENSNVISYVNAAALVPENMVKLPVVVYHRSDEQAVYIEAKVLRERLEQRAIEQEKNGGDYIRPIVLLQAESKNDDDSTDFEKVKQTLLDLGIPEPQIKIKTANIDELKGIDLLSRACEVRYIITINALKEGWDCSFAYILATFANRSSKTDVTQLLGRVLRNPYARPHSHVTLMCSYVITASPVFQETLQQLGDSLKMVGFSENDYRVAIEQENSTEPASQSSLAPQQAMLELQPQQAVSQHEVLPSNAPSGHATHTITPLEHELTQLETAKQDYMQQNAEDDSNVTEIQKNMQKGVSVNIYPMRDEYIGDIERYQLPQFTIRVSGDFFAGDTIKILNREELLSDFRLANQDSNINIATVDSNIWQIDVVETKQGTDSQIQRDKLKQKDINELIQSTAMLSESSQIHQIIYTIFNSFAKKAFYPVNDEDLRTYIQKIIQALNQEQRLYCLKNIGDTVERFKLKINGLMNDYAEKQFDEKIDVANIQASTNFQLTKEIVVTNPMNTFARSLYEQEDSVNGLELKFVEKMMSLDNIQWWHRNLSRGKGFALNGFLNNHYPDFIILTKNKTIILVETKGNDRDGSDTKYKVKLGNAWQNQANLLTHKTGYRYRYFMVFDQEAKDIASSKTIDEMVGLIEKL